MTLCDTGPLIALIDQDDPNHTRCVDALRELPPEPLLTTWPCLAEAMYLIGRAGGFPAQDELWSFVEDGLLRLDEPRSDDWERMRELMDNYRDAPMDLGDASLVVRAERLGSRRIFSLDHHFYAYRTGDGDSFEVIP